MIYEVKVPIYIEQRSDCDTYDMENTFALNVNKKGKYNDIEYYFEINEGDSSIYFKSIEANSREKCYSIIGEFLDDFLPICSLIIQSNHLNQHYSHLKLIYFKPTFIIISEVGDSNHAVEDSVYIETYEANRSYDSCSSVLTMCNGLDNLEELYFCFSDDMNFRFLLDCYYRALSATDYMTKFYNAFVAIEFIEQKYVNNIVTSKLMENHELDKIINFINDESNSFANSERIKNRISSTIKHATLESRSEKLRLILTEFFSVNVLELTNNDFEISIKFIKEIIKIRNSLFHGRDIDKRDVKRNCLYIMNIINWILMNWRKLHKTAPNTTVSDIPM